MILHILLYDSDFTSKRVTPNVVANIFYLFDAYENNLYFTIVTLHHALIALLIYNIMSLLIIHEITYIPIILFVF